jgi:hypothetical protein
MRYKELNVTTEDIADQLQTLALNRQYKDLRDNLIVLKEEPDKLDRIVRYFVSEEAETIVKKIRNNLKDY